MPAFLFGRPLPRTCNFSYEHDFIDLFQDSQACIFSICAPLYRKGHSLKEISALTGLPYSTLRDQLLHGGLTLRSNKSVTTGKVLRQPFKSSAAPPFGFCYLDGRLEKDSGEYPTLQIIEQQRRQGKTPTAIAKYLNGRKLKPRKGKVWKQPTIYYIVQRLKQTAKNGTGENHELR